jgi:predicted nucleic-acid-binding protein
MISSGCWQCRNRSLILPEVLIETVWDLESVYRCKRLEVCNFLTLISEIQVFTFPDRSVIRNAVGRYKKGGDFADHIIVAQARKHSARRMLSFDQKLQNRFPEFVVGDLKGF